MFPGLPGVRCHGVLKKKRTKLEQRKPPKRSLVCFQCHASRRANPGQNQIGLRKLQSTWKKKKKTGQMTTLSNNETVKTSKKELKIHGLVLNRGGGESTGR